MKNFQSNRPKYRDELLEALKLSVLQSKEGIYVSTPARHCCQAYEHFTLASVQIRYRAVEQVDLAVTL
jgi:hypothetical protein